jgi:hypothetical protein
LGERKGVAEDLGDEETHPRRGAETCPWWR